MSLSVYSILSYSLLREKKFPKGFDMSASLARIDSINSLRMVFRVSCALMVGKIGSSKVQNIPTYNRSHTYIFLDQTFPYPRTLSILIAIVYLTYP